MTGRQSVLEHRSVAVLSERDRAGPSLSSGGVIAVLILQMGTAQVLGKERCEHNRAEVT